MATERLTVEVTESAALVDPERAVATLEALRGSGVGVSIDDFGTGNASIEYLATLPASELKIDRSFITHMLEDARSEAIVRSTIDLARNLELTVVAEGIETEAVMQHLAASGRSDRAGLCHLATAARRGAHAAADWRVRACGLHAERLRRRGTPCGLGRLSARARCRASDESWPRVTAGGGVTTWWEPSSNTITPPCASQAGAARGPLRTAALALTSAASAVGANAVACTTPVNAGLPVEASSR